MALSKQQSLSYIRSRRSIYPKEFEQGTVSRDEVMSMIEAARYAPTHKNTEPWRFKVFEGDALERLAAKQVSTFLQAKGENETSLKKTEKMRFNAERSSAVLAIIMQRDERERVRIEDEIWAVACAVQNMHLHATSLNIGGYWSTGAATNLQGIRTFLQLNERDVHMGWFYLGRFTGEKPRIKERLTVDEVASFYH